MFPILLEVGGFKIYSYGFFIALGYLSTLALGRFLARSRGLDPSPFMDLAFIAIVTGVIGSRLLYVITAFDYFREHPGELFDFWNGGLVFYGGLILAALCCYAYGLWRKMPVWLGTDIMLTGVAFAHGFGRIGCLAAGCCHGTVCDLPWAIRNETDFVDPLLKGRLIHPVQAYEALSLFVLSGVMAWLIRSRRARDGTAALLYLTGYGAIRFVMELFRGDLDRGSVGVFSTSQAIAIALFLLGCGLFAARFRRHGREHL